MRATICLPTYNERENLEPMVRALGAVLERIDLDGIGSRGYAFQIETTYRALRAGFRVVEVPIRFVDREAGGSKMSRSIVLEAIWKVPALRAAALLGRL